MLHFHRGERRYQRRRLFQKRLSQNLNFSRLVKDYQTFALPTIRRDVLKDDWAYLNAVLRVTTPRMCSCWMCQSERKVRGTRTFQEQRFIERFKDID